MCKESRCSFGSFALFPVPNSYIIFHISSYRLVFLKTDEEPHRADGESAYGTAPKVKRYKNTAEPEHEHAGKYARKEWRLVLAPHRRKERDERRPLYYHNSYILPNHFFVLFQYTGIVCFLVCDKRLFY